MKMAFAILAVALIAAAAAAVPLNPYLDFQVLFHANLGLLRGISLYDRAGQVEMISQIANVPSAQVYVLPFPYPPWYALSTIWLARIPVDQAVRVWFGLNLLMLAASIALMTGSQPTIRRALLLLGAILWLPALGSLFVGQYGFPVLLGAALTVHALKNEKPGLVTLAAVLLTFKPHLGVAVVALVLAYLLTRGGRFARQALLDVSVAAASLLALGFLASPRWPAAYAISLSDFRAVAGVPDCTQCVSLPMTVARLFGWGLGDAAWVAIALGVLTCAWMAWRWRAITSSPFGLVSIGTLVTLLVSPYLLNYDYLLLLVPFSALAIKADSRGEWIALGLAYVLPAVALALWGSAGNSAFVASTLIVLVLTLRRIRIAGQEGAQRAA